MAKPEVEEVSPRAVRKGQIILIKGTEVPEAVRSIEVVLNMANGQALVYDVSEMVEVVVEPDETGYQGVVQILPASEEDQRTVEVVRINKLEDLRKSNEDAVEVVAAIDELKESNEALKAKEEAKAFIEDSAAQRENTAKAKAEVVPEVEPLKKAPKAKGNP